MSMDEARILKAVVDMVPNWYVSTYGPHNYSLQLGDSKLRFFSHRAPTPKLSQLLQDVRTHLPLLAEKVRDFPATVGVDLVQEYFAERWLAHAEPAINWRNLFDYHRATLGRTYENNAIIFNLLIKPGKGATDITDPAMQKILDPLASSSMAYLEVDPELRYLDYQEIRTPSLQDSADYRFYPEFLHPFVSLLDAHKWFAHKTQRGDLIVLNHSGLAAAKRKGRWKLYDPATLKNSIADVLGDYRIGANLFEIVFDLSFRRHGALLIFDPERRLLENISNPESILRDEQSDPARKMLRDAVGNIQLGSNRREERKKGIFLEVAGLDGAVLFTTDQILAVGAMLRAHENASGQVGARSTAARSAYLYGSRPVKVSSDGEITLYFQSSDGQGNASDATMEFL